jgi:hypothetical protein
MEMQQAMKDMEEVAKANKVAREARRKEEEEKNQQGS